MGDFVPTRAARLKKNAEKLHDLIVYESHKKKSSNSTNVKPKKENANSNKRLESLDSDEEIETNDEPIDEKRRQELEMKRFRYDVIKFGMSGFEKHKAQQAKVALAISLGAKPPKNRKMNYKKLMKKRKEEKIKEAKQMKIASGFNPNQLLIKKKKGDKSKPEDKKRKDGVLGVYGKVTKDAKAKRKGRKTRKGKS